MANNAPDTINFTANITLTAPLPLITNTYASHGGWIHFRWGRSPAGLPYCFGRTPKTLTRLSNLTIQNVSGQTAKGQGRAFSIDSTSSLTLIATTNPFTNSRATEEMSPQRVGTDIFLASGGSLTFIIPSGTFRSRRIGVGFKLLYAPAFKR